MTRLSWVFLSCERDVEMDEADVFEVECVEIVESEHAHEEPEVEEPVVEAE